MGFDSDTLKKYLTGKFSLDDKKKVDEYFSEDQYEQRLDHELEAYWESLTFVSNKGDIELKPILTKMNQRINRQIDSPGKSLLKRALSF